VVSAQFPSVRAQKLMPDWQYEHQRQLAGFAVA
jgi:hypothetical protein